MLLLLIALPSFAQDTRKTGKRADPVYTYRLSTPVITALNIGQGGERTNTQHIELHFKYELDTKNILGVKFATWRLFQPMGILWWDGLLDKLESQSEFYPGYVRETGLGISYQRMVWKGLFAAVEVLPQLKTYLDEDNSRIARGFKLYTSYHIGYHIPLFKGKRLFLEPQIHCQNWMMDTQAPSGFKALDDAWRTYFLFEPNMYLGFRF
ncbi:MAG: hypothetical protein NW241_04955 [Bacteroidia bacterium]|nr:hypothetical protein [Bacteroidia bacterium]